MVVIEETIELKIFEVIELTFENRKGGHCPYVTQFCQKGYCLDCQIYKELKWRVN
jgi:hypothetical protein